MNFSSVVSLAKSLDIPVPQENTSSVEFITSTIEKFRRTEVILDDLKNKYEKSQQNKETYHLFDDQWNKDRIEVLRVLSENLKSFHADRNRIFTLLNNQGDHILRIERDAIDDFFKYIAYDNITINPLENSDHVNFDEISNLFIRLKGLQKNLEQIKLFVQNPL